MYIGSTRVPSQTKDVDGCDDQTVKYYLELILGMPVLMVRESCFNKLDNLYRHSNIFGFAYGKRHVWRITGIIENRRKEKCVKMEKLNSKDVIELQWAKFQEEFRCAFISCFSTNYSGRGVALPENQKKGDNLLTLKVKIENEENNSKTHCILGCEFAGQKTREMGGKMMVYLKLKGEASGQESYRYLGSGDLSLISMKLRPGEYLLVL